MAFEYERQLTKFLHLNVRTEKHGDQDVTAVDLNLRFTSSNNSLAMLSPTLKSSLYEKDENNVEIEPDADHLTVVKNPKMGRIKWDDKYENVRFVFHIGATGKDDVISTEATAGKIVLDPKQGGTVVYDYQVSLYPSDKDLAKMAGKLNQEVFITLDPEGGEEQAERADNGEGANEIADEMKAQRSKKGGGKANASAEPWPFPETVQ
jgi:hypothetical protein